jgi:CheY-like chemotaxis protein
VVDDEEFCISAMQVILESIGINCHNQVDFCINGLEAVNQVKKVYECGLQYQIILTDFNMPIMDGIIETANIRNYLETEIGLPRKDQPMIVGITGHVHEQFKIDGLKAGMDKIMTKPIYISDLEELLIKSG